MFAEDIHKITRKLIRKSETNDPFKIAQDNGIMVRMCNDFKELNGIYTIIKRKRVIILNSSMPLETQKIVCAHELGHDILHREFAKGRILHDFMLYDMTIRIEHEANMFAADILISDDDIYDLACGYGYDMEKISKKLNIDINLLGIKIENMNCRGYDFKLGIPRKNNLFT